jgi:hypothetical protein
LSSEALSVTFKRPSGLLMAARAANARVSIPECILFDFIWCYKFNIFS